MNVYCDTSVLIALAAEEPTWSKHARWLAAHASRVLFSTFGWGEFLDGAARRVRRRELAIDQFGPWSTKAQAIFEEWRQLDLTNADVIDATRYISDTPLRALKLADAIHLATCRRAGAILLTSDRQQAAAAVDLAIPNHLILADPES